MNSNNLPTTFLLLFVLLLVSCRVEPVPINYGQDQCNFCKMNIVDMAHSAQNVTKKGKQFKYDAIECLIRDLSTKDPESIAMNLVANYGDPGHMIDAVEAHYIISPNIKSPMGANLSALSDLEKTKQLLEEQGGEIFDWESIQEKITKK